ncbi:MAG: hypothetical protein U5J95_03540 [Balneolaceae bacterium]|nr:hypothetical protein [Balneolaceae bacterium]
MGFEPKQLEDWQLESLKTLAQEVQGAVGTSKKQNQLEKKTAELERQTTFLENATDLVFILDPAITVFQTSIISWKKYWAISLITSLANL